MKCQEVSEFVSALYDGETIPKDAAEHIGICDHCREHLNAYSSMGNEMRRLASLEPESASKPDTWQQIRRSPAWWQKGFATMRIPRIAFASMLIVILLLCGGLVLVRAGAGGRVLILGYKPVPTGPVLPCTMTIVNNHATTCSHITHLSSGALVFNARFLRQDEDRTEVGIRTKFLLQTESVEGDGEAQLRDVPEQILSFEQGESKRIAVSGMGTIELTGNYLDHIPTLIYQPDETLDPQENEFRVVTPVLIRDQKVVVNIDGNSISCCNADATLMIFVPGEGRYLISGVPFEGAVEGSVHLGQIEFVLEGHKYLLLTSMPITRSEHVWVTHEADFKPSERMVRPEEARDDRPMFLVRSLDKLQQPRIPHS